KPGADFVIAHKRCSAVFLQQPIFRLECHICVQNAKAVKLGNLQNLEDLGSLRPGTSEVGKTSEVWSSVRTRLGQGEELCYNPSPPDERPRDPLDPPVQQAE